MDAKTIKKIDTISSEETVHLSRFIAMEFLLKHSEEISLIKDLALQVEFLKQKSMVFTFDYLNDVIDKIQDEKNERSVHAICYAKFIDFVKEINQKETR